MASIKDRKIKTVHLLNAVQVQLPGTATNSLVPGKDIELTLELPGVLVETTKGAALVPWASIRAVYFE